MAQQQDFAQLRVAAFESRRADEMVRLIERWGGVPLVSPSMREVAVPSRPELVRFAHELITGQVEVVVFMTGVGFQHLLTLVERHVDRQRFLDALADVTDRRSRAQAGASYARRGDSARPGRSPSRTRWRELLARWINMCHWPTNRSPLQEYGLTEPQSAGGVGSSRCPGAEAAGLSLGSARRSASRCRTTSAGWQTANWMSCCSPPRIRSPTSCGSPTN